MITTDCCALTELHPTDLEALVRLHTNPEVMRYLGGPRDEAAMRADLTNLLETGPKNPLWAIRPLDSNEFMGIITLTPHHDGEDTEVSYLLLPEFWGQGYATETVQAIIDYGLSEVGHERLIAETQTANKPSIRLLKRLGMVLERKVERFGEEQSIYTTT